MTNDYPSIDGELLDALELLLVGRSKDEAITSSEISDMLDMNDGEASPQAREAIRVLMDERNIPIRSGNVGYWVCQSEQEANEYRANLRGRIEGIEARLAMFNYAWNEHKQREAMRDADDLTPEMKRKIRNDDTLELSDFEG